MASPGPSGDDLCRAYAQLWSDPLPNGQIVRPLRGFPSAVYFSWAKHFKRMADDAGAGADDHLVQPNGLIQDPTVSELDSSDLSMENCHIVNRFDIGPDHVRLLYHRQESYLMSHNL